MNPGCDRGQRSPRVSPCPVTLSVSQRAGKERGRPCVQISAELYWSFVISSSRAAPLSPPRGDSRTRCHQGWRAGGSGAQRSPGEDPSGVKQAAALVWSSGRSPCLVGGAGGPARAAGPAPFLLYLFLIVGEAGRNCRLCSASSCRGGRIPAASPTRLGPCPGRSGNALRPWQDLAGRGRTWQCHSGTPGAAVRTHCSAWPSCPCPFLGALCPGNSSRVWGWASQKRNLPPPSLSPKMRSRWDTRSHPPPCHPLPGGRVGEGTRPIGTVGFHCLRLFGGQGPPKAGGPRLQARWGALGWAGGLRGGRLGVPAPPSAPWQHHCSSPVRLLRDPRGS